MTYGKVDYPECPCSVCGTEFKPKTKRSVICESEVCKRERYKVYQKEYHKEYHGKRMEDPEYRRRKAEYQREYHMEKSKDPEYTEQEKNRRRERYQKRRGSPSDL